VPDPSNVTYGGLYFYRQLLCEISRKAQTVRITFSSRFLQESKFICPGAHSRKTGVEREEKREKRGAEGGGRCWAANTRRKRQGEKRAGQKCFLPSLYRSRPATLCN